MITLGAEESSNETVLRGFNVATGAVEWEQRTRDTQFAKALDALVSPASAKTPFLHVRTPLVYYVRNVLTGAWAGSLAAGDDETFAALRVLPAPSSDPTAPHAELISHITATAGNMLLWRVVELAGGKKPTSLPVPPVPFAGAQLRLVPTSADASMLIALSSKPGQSPQLAVISRGQTAWSTYSLTDVPAAEHPLELIVASGSDGVWAGLLLRSATRVYAYALGDTPSTAPRLLAAVDAVSVSPLIHPSAVAAPYIVLLQRAAAGELTLALLQLGTGALVHKQVLAEKAGVRAPRVLDASLLGGKSPTAFRALLELSDLRVQAVLVNVSGAAELMWQRDEGMSQWVACMFVDLPPPPPAKLLSWHSVSSLLQHFAPEKLWQPATRATPTNYADLYGLERALVGVSSAGVLYALNTLGGDQLWRTPLALAPSSHYQLVFLKGAGLVVLGKDAQQRHVAVVVDRDTGAVTRTHVLEHSVQLVLPLRGSHKGHDALLLVDSAHLAHLFPSTPEALQLLAELLPTAGMQFLSFKTSTQATHCKPNRENTRLQN